MADRHIVYVHGICAHPSGYSDDWFDAMRSFVPSLQPGDLSPAPGDLSKNRHEVLWSDIVNAEAAVATGVPFAAVAESASVDEQAKREECHHGLLEELEQRMKATQAERMPSGTPPAEVAATPAALGLADIPGINCLDDFVTYLTNDSVRDRVLARFDEVIEPLLAADKQVEVIAHSWGSVVAYEALRRLDPTSSAGSGPVRNFFTVGSALAIKVVKNWLIPEASDLRRPALVDRWINLDAHGDFVGGSLTHEGFELKPEHDLTGLDPVGCGLIAFPACAHGSYFDPDNRAVNRDIFGKFVGS